MVSFPACSDSFRTAEQIFGGNPGLSFQVSSVVMGLFFVLISFTEHASTNTSGEISVITEMNRYPRAFLTVQFQELCIQGLCL